MKELIVKDPKIMFGSPTIKGTRITVSNIQGMHNGGDSVEYLALLFNITEEQVLACINYKE